MFLSNTLRVPFAMHHGIGVYMKLHYSKISMVSYCKENTQRFPHLILVALKKIK